MHLAFHGGKCCGIKTIYGFGDGKDAPNQVVDALEAVKADDSDILYNDVRSDQRFFHEAAPAEPRIARLDRYIDYIKMRRPRHIVEVTLAEGPFCNQKVWYDLLEQRGFIMVNKGKNSNSGNLVKVFHLNIKEKLT